MDLLTALRRFWGLPDASIQILRRDFKKMNYRFVVNSSAD